MKESRRAKKRSKNVIEITRNKEKDIDARLNFEHFDFSKFVVTKTVSKQKMNKKMELMLVQK